MAASRDGFDRWVNATNLPPLLTKTSIEMRDRQGKLMRSFPVENGRTRLAVRLDQVDPRFINMLITYEDKRFYSHSGIDPRAMLRATWQALWAGEVVSGGSTLTMQVARLIENSGTGRWHGKWRQIRLALALERRLSKAEILELYLLHAPYGGALEGVRAASIAWFGKEPRRLTNAEAALLVALPQSPEGRRPDRFAKSALAARDRVLERTGQKATHAPLPSRMTDFPRLAPHLADRLRAKDPGKPRHRVTLDYGLQSAMEDLAKRAVASQPPGVSAAILVADHTTGAILAQVGSPAYSAKDGTLGFVDMVHGVRSPGSTLKPLIYGLAFDQGLAHPETLINDAPVSFGRYAPQNFDGQFRGEVTARAALQASLNIPPVLLLEEIGPARLMQRLKRSGAEPVLPGGAPGLAVGLGGVGLTLHDLVQLYAGLANGGVARPLYVTETNAPEPQRILSRTAAWHVAHILAGVPPPPGTAAKEGAIAYKTGTSYGHRDAWAIGFDGQHVIGVWLGRPDGTPVPGAFGGDLAAPLVFEAFGRLGTPLAPLPPPPPETVMVTTAALPGPLQRFASRRDAFEAVPDQPVLTFPPDGAVLQSEGFGVALKLRNGTLPFTVLINGAPVRTKQRNRNMLLDFHDPGFSTIAVVDAKGRAVAVTVELR